MRRNQKAWAGSAIIGAVAVVTILLGPVTNYASDSVPSWAQKATVIWPVFGALTALSVGLLLFARHLDGGGRQARLIPVAPLATLRPISLRPPHIAADVRGREAELELLTRLLREPSGRFAVISGIGGVGKTTVAAAFAQQAEQAGHAVFWIRWREPAVLAEQLTQVALACGLFPGALEVVRAGQGNLTDVVWEQLSRSRKWLVVIDNVDEIERMHGEGEKLGDYRGWVRPHGGGLLLLTSRNTSPDAWGARAELLDLKPLTAMAGGQMLLDGAPLGGSPQEAASLAGRLGGLPLALQAVSSYLTAVHSRYRTFASFHNALEVDLPDLLGGDRPNAGNPDTARTLVNHTWELSLDQLANGGTTLARPLVRLLSLFAEAPIPLSLITPSLLSTVTGSSTSRTNLDHALVGLATYGLLGTPPPLGNHAPDEVPCVVLHPLVREINALALSRIDGVDPASWRQAVAGSLIAAVQETRRAGRAGWATAYVLAPHLPFLLVHSHAVPLADVRPVLLDLAAVLRESGAGGPELVLRQHVLDSETRELGSDHPGTLASRCHLAGTLTYLGRYAEADDMLHEVIQAQARVLGPDHQDTLASRHERARALNYLGRYAETTSMIEEIIIARSRVLGPDHPATLNSRNELARAFHGLGRQADAVDLYREIIAAATRVLGPEHPITLSNRNNLARALNGTGRYAEAASILHEVSSVRADLLGPNHPVGFYSRNNLAASLNGLGRHAEAADVLREIIADRSRVLGRDHPDTLTSRHDFAVTLTCLTRNREAADILLEVVADRSRVLGPDHLDTLTSREELAEIAGDLRTRRRGWAGLRRAP
ncbi:tetratricopeptide repeat protein [Streptomyces sp. NPDC002659]|uniref:tetratricopeptide repeat protein n=1 Tax=Streptomyces sp. NPDC002659 TaxID=3364656 RepID=UPI0036A1EDE7